MSKKATFRGDPNPERAAAERERRRSSAASPHADSRTARARTRQSRLARDLRDAA